MDINVILQQVVDHHAPDLHLKVGRAPVIRMSSGDVFFSENSLPLRGDEILEVAEQVAGPEKFKIFNEMKEVDFSYGCAAGRFRVNLYRDKDGAALAFRAIPVALPTLASLGLPKLFGAFAMKPRGLVLVTGPTGSGKSTTLAAMVNHANQQRKGHIITIEDPIEFVHESQGCLVTQREVSSHTSSFMTAIRSSLRQDPDVVLVGEMRDLETIAAAVTLAETGHLVLSTLHTTDAAQTVDRMVDVFPPHQQQQIRAQLAVALTAVVSQTLVPRKDGNGRVPAFEIMVVNDAIRHCIKEGSTHQIYSLLQLGRSAGMQTLDDSLAALVAHGIVDEAHAMTKVHDAEAFQRSVAQMIAQLSNP